MFGFPVNLQGNEVQKMTFDADNGFPKIQQREIFYSVKNGYWNDPNTWQTASGRVGKFPSQFDDVYVRNNITIASGSCFNLFNNGLIQFDGGNGTLNVYGKINSIGTIDMSQSTTFLFLFDDIINFKNLVTNPIGTSRIYFSKNGDQYIPNLPYRSLYIEGTGTKYLTSDLTISQNLWLQTNSRKLELGGFNLIVNGITVCDNLSKNAPGSILFVGNTQLSGIVNLSGNPTIEFRGGLDIYGSGFNSYNFGTNNLTFTTNNQSIGGNTQFNPNTGITISGGITLTIAALGLQQLQMSYPINGDNALSKLTNQTTIVFLNQLSAENSMTTGIVDFTTSANTIQYNGNYSATIPSYFTTFHNLTISGTGTKSLGVNTTLNGNLSLPNVGVVGGVFELSSYDLFVNGTTTLGGQANVTLSKNGSGNITFVGLLLISNPNILSFTGNPNIEVRGGITQQSNFTSNTGTGNLTYTTNNQTNTISGNGITFYNVVIANNIILTNTGSSAFIVSNILNGSNASSSFVNQGITYISSNILPMNVGILDISTSSNTFGYNGNLSMNIPNLSYRNLFIGGTGTKSLTTNSTINGNLVIGLSGNLECSIYDLTINGTTTLSDGTFGASLSKSGSGTILFIGAVSCFFSGNYFNLPGNPILEFRNGFSYNSNSPSLNFGNGIIKVSTNNQTFNLSQSPTINNPILISGAITLTYISTSWNFNGTINGDDPNSKLLMSASSTLTYRNATQPMATGILDTSTNLNTWIYGNANQDIKGGPSTLAKQVYRNLTLNGGGTKTLQGYVSVLNTYTLTSPATLNNNGFTLTNP
jgi:hypothetical protein